ncbi:MAG: CRISPR system precrRNA processing endoribonuclease RAMP protein Cas6 [Anaerolineales bacterium]|nr:CRISPR system precrRNA processing endoribonuclease RAMP protein Cas6 [Anaerolineales bacterium]
MKTASSESFPLTALRLRFRCAAESHIQLGGLRAGSNLRGALVNVMRRATCAGDPSDPAHLAVCPVCWLVAANDHPGQERRGYVITPVLTEDPKGFFRVFEGLEPGEMFDFHITLFGEAAHYLPYFVLAVPETGRTGLGPGRGRFALRTIHAEHPLNGDWTVLAEGENVVRPPVQNVTHADIQQKAKTFADGLGSGAARLRLDFMTPLRIILEERLLKSPDFGAIFNHILRRLDELAVQYAGGAERPLEERQRLWDLANRVRLVESQTRWADVRSGSSRSGQPTWVSGLVGPAWYSAPVEVWRELLPWLLWGEIAQVGKDTAKGNGVFKVQRTEERCQGSSP